MYLLPLAPHCWVCPGSQSMTGLFSSGYEHKEQLHPGHSPEAPELCCHVLCASSRLKPWSALRHCSTGVCHLGNGRDGGKGLTGS